jgi:hypothetical protein
LFVDEKKLIWIRGKGKLVEWEIGVSVLLWIWRAVLFRGLEDAFIIPSL